MYATGSGDVSEFETILPDPLTLPLPGDGAGVETPDPPALPAPLDLVDAIAEALETQITGFNKQQFIDDVDALVNPT